MTGVEIGFSSLIAAVVLILLRVPIGLALTGVSFIGLWVLMGWQVAWGALGVVPLHFAANWTLSSLPMFLLLGYLCHKTMLTNGMFRLARLWFASIPGGLAIAAVFGASGFAAVSGSSIACSAAVGRIAVPEMLKAKYAPELATGTVAVAGTIGALIPPSIILILYSVIAQVPVGPLFLGGIGAGVLTAISYVLVILARVRLNPSLAPPVRSDANTQEKIEAFKDTWPVILLVLAVFGGLFGGFFTPTEAGAAGAAAACLIASLKGSFTFRRLADAAMETATTTSALLMVGIGASLLTRLLSISGTAASLTDAIAAIEADPAMLLLGLVGLYLLLGLFIEPVGAMLLTLPIVLPLTTEAGFSLIWFGIILTKLLEIGMITPPVGMNVFVIKAVVGDSIPISTIFRGIFWFFVADLVVLAILIAVPDTILLLPRFFGP